MSSQQSLSRHRLGFIEVCNFRACKKVRLALQDYTPLVGQNNTGKSCILRAIAWTLKPSALPTSDFNDPSQPVRVTARIDGISDELINQIPHTQHQNAIRPYCQSGSFWIRASATNGSKSIKREVADVGLENGNENPVDWVAYPTGLPEAVSALLPEPIQINALEDIASDLGKATAGSVIKSLLEQIMAPILAEDEELRGALQTVERRLSGTSDARSPHLNDFDQQATDSLKDFFPDLALNLSLPSLNAKDLFKSGELHVIDRLTNDRRRFDELGAGAQRSLQISMIRLLADAKRAESESTSRTLLLVDEPELYLHPQGIRRIRQSLEKLSAGRFQVVFSTHSPMMLNRDRAPDTVIISKQSGQGTIARHTLRETATVLQDHQAQSDVLYELGNLSEIYFSELVVLCEGKTDRRLIPLAYERYFNQSPSSELIAYVSVNGSPSIIGSLRVLKELNIANCAVTDLDFVFKQTDQLKSLGFDASFLQLEKTKEILKELSATHSFSICEAGFPRKSETCRAEAAWELFAENTQGKEIIQQLHAHLKDLNIWIWCQGAIEKALNPGRPFDPKRKNKGEGALASHELRIRNMQQSDIDSEMPLVANCLQWIHSKIERSDHPPTD